MYKKLFPQLAKKRWRYFDLGYLSTLFFPTAAFPQNPLMDAGRCGEWIEEMHRTFYTDFSFGGYFENRSHMWRGTYVEAQNKGLHLGVDFNVPMGTLVHSPQDGIVIDVLVDKDTEIGWGGRVTVEYGKIADKRLCLTFGHLSRVGLPSVGDKIKGGAEFGIVGRTSENGNVFEHLHVQRCDISPEYNEEELRDYFKLLDGYGYSEIDYKTTFPSPAMLLLGI